MFLELLVKPYLMGNQLLIAARLHTLECQHQLFAAKVLCQCPVQSHAQRALGVLAVSRLWRRAKVCEEIHGKRMQPQCGCRLPRLLALHLCLAAATTPVLLL